LRAQPQVKKLKSTYVCQNCGHVSARWLGRCPNCEGWNTFVEEIATPSRSSPPKRRSGVLPVPITELDVSAEPRMSCGIPELDRVLGGGIVPGSVVLVGGDPGIGKSTLMLQMAAAMGEKTVLYCSGEESARQIRLRAERLKIRPTANLLLINETDLDALVAVVQQSAPDLLIVDSIQTMARPGMESAPGTVSQVREATALLMRQAKTHAFPVFLVGHVTKEGALAGPKVIEHMVDTVLQFEGERHYAYRILRAMKNRFGSTNEIGIFEMQDGGLREVTNPSEVFLAQRKHGASGSIVIAALEGSRPLLLEVQALVAPTSYGVPQRTATGIDGRRLQMILAVLEKRVGLSMGQYDVFVNVAGGVRVEEPAADLGTALAIVSSLRDRPADQRAVAIGEVGLAGEIRRVHQSDRRIAEAAKLGFERMVLPTLSAESPRPPRGLELIEVDTVEQAIVMMIGR
jgi:DNA repair protein RadA/Sms